jgi:type I restriction enzyme R subunit
MLVANKFQTGFDQPKLCAMYVDKKLAGVECVQTLSRLNRCYPGKAESGTFVLDFYNKPEDVLAAFQPYYNTAELADVSDPNRVHELFEKLRSQGIYQWHEVEQFYTAFMNHKIGAAAISNICKPAVERWQHRYRTATAKYKEAKDLFDRTKKSGDAVLIANAENTMKEHKKELDTLIMFKKDLGSFTRFYEFMSQIVDYDRIELDQLSLFARHLRPLLREDMPEEDDIDLSSVVLTHYRLSRIREQNLVLTEGGDEDKLQPTSELGSGKARDKKVDFLSQVIQRLNEIFDAEGLTEDDMLNYARTILDKVKENQRVMDQFTNNPPEQAMLGDFPNAFFNAVMESSEAHENQKLQCLSDNKVSDGLMRLIFDMWQHEAGRKAV